MRMFHNSNKNKIFCVSFQRTGTTSVGQFFKNHNYKVSGYDKHMSTQWSALRFIGDYETIFSSKKFKQNQVFEDNPWWEDDFYKLLYHRFPNSKFVMFTRDADDWFDSMVRHSKGKTLGNTFRHCKLYKRETEFYSKFPKAQPYNNIKEIDNLLDLNESHRTHYTQVYNLRNKEIVDFFNAINPSALHVGSLDDKEKWIKLGRFFNINISSSYEVHENKSKI